MTAILRRDLDVAALRAYVAPMNVDVANHNALDQAVLSGKVSDVDRAVDALRGDAAWKAKAIALRVSAPFHSRYMEPVRAPLADKPYEDPAIARVTFTGSDLRIQLTATDIVGDAYRLENPPRIVLDFRKGAASAPGSPQPLQPSSPREVPGIHTIVIDPGHGGRDVGAVGTNGLM